ncbi:MAG: DUF4234 domain-containing protein [Anaerovorax sp.]
MKERDLVTCVLLTIVTLGIYGLYWFVHLTDESLEVTGEQGMKGLTSLFFLIVTFGLYGLYWSYKLGQRLDRALEQRGMTRGNSYSGILYLILDFCQLSIIVWALAQSELNKLNRQSWTLS